MPNLKKPNPPICRQPSKPHLVALTRPLAGLDVFRQLWEAHEVKEARIDHTGWYCDPYHEDTCVGVVARLRGRDGNARYIPGWRFKAWGDEGVFDLSDVFEAPADGPYGTDEALIDCARRADHLAEIAAEKEREYQTAWRAGSRWADAKSEESELRKEALQILAERRSVRTDATRYPALCGTIRKHVFRITIAIRESRKERTRLAEGESADLYFYPDASAIEAFCDGAGITRAEFPA